MKKSILAAVLMITVAIAMIAGGTMAWFTASFNVPNAILTAGAGTVSVNVDMLSQGQQSEIGTIIEENWAPGTTRTVSWKVVNSGKKDIVFRFCPNVEVRRLRNDFNYSILPDLPNPWNGENLSGVMSDEAENWIVDTGDDENNWNERIYYYLPVVEAGEEVTLSMDITLKGKETGNEYQAASFIIGGLIEAVQAAGNAPFEMWGVDYYSGSSPSPSPTPTPTGIITAKSGSQEDVQEAIDQAQDGDTVLIPAGTWIWTTTTAKYPSVHVGRQLTWSPNTYESKSITIRGAGADQTIIYDQTGSAYHEVPLLIYPISGKEIRVTGISFVPNDIGVEIAAAGGNWRIDHCNFNGHDGVGRGIKTRGYGVIDHCVFRNFGQGVSVFGNGHQSWAEPLTLGSDNAVYIENCSFINDNFYDGAADAYDGARYVFRYNQSNTCIGHHGLDSGGYRSTFSYEVYNNIFNPMKSPPFMISSRGGTGVWFNNTVVGEGFPIGLNKLLRLVNYRTINSYPVWGMCDGTNPIDGNELENGYPARDQIGRSTDERLWGGVDDLPAPKQKHEPLYGWGNTCNGTPIRMAPYHPEYGIHIQENRDFYNDTPRPGYVPYPYPHPMTLVDYPGEQRSLDLELTVMENQLELQWQAVINAVTYRIVQDWDQDNVMETNETSVSFSVPEQGSVFIVYALDVEGTVIASEGKYYGAFE